VEWKGESGEGKVETGNKKSSVIEIKQAVNKMQFDSQWDPRVPSSIGNRSCLSCQYEIVLAMESDT
jgi:hypothetical protein